VHVLEPPELLAEGQCEGRGRGWVVAQLRVLEQAVDGVDAEPSTPRSRQKRTTPVIASTTSGLRQSRSGCSG